MAMAKTFRPWDLDQAWLLPPSVRDFVPPEHLAHFARDLVRESLDLSPILGTYVEERGYPPFHPTMMTALLLYAYSQGVYSSRRIARGCQERVDFMAVTGMQTPDFRTVNQFRARHLEALSGLFVQVLQLCQQAGLAKLGHVSLDGTKVKANASKHSAMSYKRMKETEPRLAEEVRNWLKQADTVDLEEDELYGETRRGDELPAWVANKVERVKKMRESMDALEREARAEAEEKRGDDEDDEGEGPAKPRRGRKPKTPPGTPKDKAQRNFTDPESRIMKTGSGYEQCFNAQAVVDADSQVIVAQGVTNATNDQKQLKPMLEQIQANTGRQAKEFSADAGYCSEANLEELARHPIRAYVATGRQKHGTASATGTRTPTAGTLRKAMRLKLKRGGYRSRYRLRKQTVEPVFGQIKGCRGFRDFLLRGLAKVQSEWSLVCTAHNLLKLAGARG